MSTYFLIPQKMNTSINEIFFLEKIYHKVLPSETVSINGNIYVRCNPIISEENVLFPFHFRRIVKNASVNMIRKTSYKIIIDY